jgi:hypothetical protein
MPALLAFYVSWFLQNPLMAVMQCGVENAKNQDFRLNPLLYILKAWILRQTLLLSDWP